MRKKTAKKQTAKKKKKQKKMDTREMGQAHDQPGRERPAKKKHAWKQSNRPGPVTIGGCAARGLHQPGWSIGVPFNHPYKRSLEQPKKTSSLKHRPKPGLIVWL
jgi:hypothetical protein